MIHIRLAAALFVVAVGACHFDDSFQIDVSVDPGRPDTEFSQACTEQAVASCAYLERCHAYYFAQGWPDAATCVDRTMLACQVLASEPHSNRDDESIRACTAPPDYPCPSDPAFEAASAALREACDKTQGELPNGSPCSTYAACASGFCPREYPGQVCGTCHPDPCAACTQGQVCAIKPGGTGACLTLQEDGASCMEHANCASGNCEGSVCASRPGEGEPCDPLGTRCAGSAQAALFCNDST